MSNKPPIDDPSVPSSPPERTNISDQVLATITALEHQLSGLKQARQEAAADVDRAALAARSKEAAADELLHHLRRRDAELNERENGAAALREQLSIQAAELQEARARMLAEQEGTRAALDEQSAAIASERRALEERAAAVDSALAGSAAEIADLRAQLNEAARGAEEGRVRAADHAVAAASLQARVAALESDRISLEEAVRQARQEADRREAEALALSCDEIAKATSRVSALEAAARELEAQKDGALEERSAALAAVESLQADLGRSQARVRELEESARAATELVAASERRVSSLESELATARQVLERASLAASEAAKELDRRDLAIEELTRRLQHPETPREAASSDAAAAETISKIELELASARMEIEKRDRAVGALVERLRAAEAGPTPAARADGGVTAIRRERLRRYRSLLQAQYRKVIAAQNALQKRHAETEHIMSQRNSLVAAANSLRQREARLASGRAAAGAIAMSCYAACSLAVVAVLSWAASAQLAPGIFAARTTIAAESRAGAPSDEELAAWSDYQVKLAVDPQFEEQLSARMKERGILELATAPDAHAFLSRNMTVSTPGEGAVQIEVRATGPERARRIAETIGTTLVSVANATRSSRPDALPSVVSESARAGSGPIDWSRVRYAGGLFAGAAAAVGFFGLVVWSRLSRAKQRFERDAALEETMEDSRWAAAVDAQTRS